MGQRPFFQRHIGVEVDLCGLRRLVTEPKSNHCQIDSAAQKFHGRGMPERMDRYVFGFERGASLRGGLQMASNEPLQGIGAEDRCYQNCEEESVGFGP